MTIIHETPVPLVFFPSIAKKVGANAAILLQLINQRIHYAMDFLKDETQRADFYKVQDDRIWVQFSYSELEGTMAWISERALKRIVQKLKQKDILLIERQLDSLGGNQPNWYSIEWEKL